MEKARIVNLPTVQQVIKTASNMYRLGWDERNGGNISVIIDPEEYSRYLPTEAIRTFPLSFNAHKSELCLESESHREILRVVRSIAFRGFMDA